MRLLYLADSWPPVSSSAAQQNFSLVKTLSDLGHDVTVVTLPIADPDVQPSLPGVNVLRLHGRFRHSYFVRLLSEILIPISGILKVGLKKDHNFDGIIFYSPTIFFGPLVKVLKWRFHCKSYLILRDIFPDWAFEIGLINNKFTFNFFKFFSTMQYSTADAIGLQSEGDKHYLKKFGFKAELLENWFPDFTSDIFYNVNVIKRYEQELNRGGFRVLYAGNLGVAQGAHILLDLAQNNPDVSFLVAGEGSYKKEIESLANEKRLSNMIFFGQMRPAELTQLVKLADFGLVLLDQRLRTNNIPGKYLFYLHHRLPSIAIVNKNNSFCRVIEHDRSGICLDMDQRLAYTLPKDLKIKTNVTRYQGVSDKGFRATIMAQYSPMVAALKIVDFFSREGG